MVIELVGQRLVEHEFWHGLGPGGIEAKISDVQFAAIALQPHDVQPLRNHTIRSRPRP